MSDDVAVCTAVLEASGLIERTVEDEEGGYRVTDRGYAKGYDLWMAMSGEDRVLIMLFLRAVRVL